MSDTELSILDLSGIRKVDRSPTQWRFIVRTNIVVSEVFTDVGGGGQPADLLLRLDDAGASPQPIGPTTEKDAINLTRKRSSLDLAQAILWSRTSSHRLFRILTPDPAHYIGRQNCLIA